MKTSPARRVFQFLKKAHDIQSTKPNLTIVVWAQVLGIVEPNAETQVTPILEDCVLLGLRDFREEVAEVERRITDPEAADALAPIAATARLLTATSQLHGDWSGVKANHLRADFLAGWQWASIYLPGTDDNITEEALREFKFELDELERCSAQPDVPESLRRLVDKQARAIRDALRRYEVRGAGPLRDAVSQGFGEILRDQDELRASVEGASTHTSDLVSKLKTVWTTAVRICGDTEKLEKGYRLAMHIYEKALPLLEQAGRAIGN